jgi:predicted TIM-barrel fold metal-dependent hydrolase
MNISQDAISSATDLGSTKHCCSRRDFLLGCGMLAVAATEPGCRTQEKNSTESIIDIHQHVSYAGRTNDALEAHQRLMGITKTILLPAGRPVQTASTHEGIANGLQAKCAGNEACYELAKSRPDLYWFAANEVPDLPNATIEIDQYLKLGGVMIAEQKFGVECDSPAMQRLYALAADYHVPILMHWQYKMYNYGFNRFYRILEKYPRTTFIGHAQTWWANIDRNYKDDAANLYPKGQVAPGGLTDRYLSDYPNMFGDLSAGSGLNALTRDEDHAREFLARHHNKLLFGSDCDDVVGTIPGCQGAQTIATIRRLVPNRRIRHKLFYANARKVLRL